jgi:hypothetical protein
MIRHGCTGTIHALVGAYDDGVLAACWFAVPRNRTPVPSRIRPRVHYCVRFFDCSLHHSTFALQDHSQATPSTIVPLRVPLLCDTSRPCALKRKRHDCAKNRKLPDHLSTPFPHGVTTFSLREPTSSLPHPRSCLRRRGMRARKLPSNSQRFNPIYCPRPKKITMASALLARAVPATARIQMAIQSPPIDGSRARRRDLQIAQ